MKKTLLVLMALSLLGPGCAKDRTMDDWCREKAEEEAARIGEVSGLYSGTLVSNEDRRSLGDFSVQIQADVKPGDMKNCAGSQLEPVARGRVTLLQGAPKIISFSDGSYNSASGGFSAAIQVKERNGELATLSLTGTLKGGMFTGSLEADGYPEAGGSFSLKRSGPATASLPQAVSSAVISGAGSQQVSSMTYDGTVRLANGTTKSAQMIILSSAGNSNQEFLYSFLPSRPSDVTISTGPGQQANFPNAQWDRRANRLQGRTSGEVAVTSGPAGGVDHYELTLDCTALSPDTADAGWSCNYYSSQYGLLLTGTFKPRRNP